MVVHAIDSDAVTFYAQRGFTQFEDHELDLFMPVKNLLATLEAYAVRPSQADRGGNSTRDVARKRRSAERGSLSTRAAPGLIL